jgi:hypothetical protein
MIGALFDRWSVIQSYQQLGPHGSKLLGGGKRHCIQFRSGNTPLSLAYF